MTPLQTPFMIELMTPKFEKGQSLMKADSNEQEQTDEKTFTETSVSLKLEEMKEKHIPDLHNSFDKDKDAMSPVMNVWKDIFKSQRNIFDVQNKIDL